MMSADSGRVDTEATVEDVTGICNVRVCSHSKLRSQPCKHLPLSRPGGCCAMLQLFPAKADTTSSHFKKALPSLLSSILIGDPIDSLHGRKPPLLDRTIWHAGWHTDGGVILGAVRSPEILGFRSTGVWKYIK